MAQGGDIDTTTPGRLEDGTTGGGCDLFAIYSQVDHGRLLLEHGIELADIKTRTAADTEFLVNLMHLLDLAADRLH
jgi:hypothetical protein